MQTMNQCLLGLVQRGQITHATALEYSNDVDELRKSLPKETSTGF
jgi:Tfp pilus assembly pilus retraction ATPase PilT